MLGALLMFAFTTFAGMLPWDKPLQTEVKQNAKVFADPYVTNYGVYNNSSPYGIQIQVSFNKSVPAPYYVLLEVYGIWDGNNYGSWKQFTINFNQGQWHRTVDYPLNYNESAAVGLVNLLEYGPI